MEAIIAMSLVGLCNLSYLCFVAYVITLSIKNNHKLDRFLITTIVCMFASLALWLWDYVDIVVTDRTEDILTDYYLDPFFFFCIGLLFDMTRLTLILVAIKDPDNVNFRVRIVYLVLGFLTLSLSALQGIQKYYSIKSKEANR